MVDSFKRHWPEYLMEAAGLGIFMMSACLFTALLVYPASPVQQAIDSPLLRRVLLGVRPDGHTPQDARRGGRTASPEQHR